MKLKNLIILTVVLSATLHRGALQAAISPDNALTRLKEGNSRYVLGSAQHPDQDVKRRTDLAKGQNPFVTILSCSDSRVPPEILFDQGLGDIFSVRVAGNVADTDEIGSIEYAAEHLKTPLLLVLGHTKCGAVTAAVNGSNMHDSLLKVVEHIAPSVTKARATGAAGDTLLEAAIICNVWNSAAEILRKSAVVRTLVASGKLKIIGAVYDIDTGKVRWLGEPPTDSGLNWPASQLLPSFATPAPVLDCINLATATANEIDLFVSLEGIVNRTQPQIACARPTGEGQFTWLKIHHLAYTLLDGYDTILKYQTHVTGLVVTDPTQPDTLNLATTIAGVKDELICGPELLSKLTNAPFNLAVVDDLRGRFTNKYEVYRYLYSKFWSHCTHRIIAGMSPKAHGDLRDYLVAARAAAIWLGPGKAEEAQVLSLFVSDMKPAAGVYMGWWPSEDNGLKWIATYGIPVLASDFFNNATVFSGVQCPINIPQIPEPPPLENKVYVALILSDGDNVQYMQHGMKVGWADPARGQIPIGWTVSPLTLDIDPGMLNYYWSTATTNDCLVSGPSGAGYAHINEWNPVHIAAFTKVSGPYMRRSGLRVITVWDKVTRSIARSFATNCTSLLGLTDESGRYSKIDLGLRTIRLTPAYTSSVTNMVDAITKASTNWNGTAPLFIAAQSDVWRLGPSKLIEVASALDTNKFKLVRPDQLFLLANKAARRR